MHPINVDTLGSWVFSRVRTAVLARLLLDSREWHARELARVLGMNHAAVGRELRSMAAVGIANCRRSGNRLYYSANEKCPVYTELAAIMRKTAGLADVIRAALAPLAERIELAYIFGSQAAGNVRPHSDIDVIVVGSVSSMELVEALMDCEKQLGREVNTSVYPPVEYREKLRLGHGFPFTVNSGPRISLIGEADESG
ncbi:nucleotidyltransferase domain-containing protein [bacterium]|nr:nucleotidyltransferase domain-containing protein [bacterium]